MANAGAGFIEKLVSLRGNKHDMAEERAKGRVEPSGSGSSSGSDSVTDYSAATRSLQSQALHLFDYRETLAHEFPSLDVKCFNLLKNYENV